MVRTISAAQRRANLAVKLDAASGSTEAAISDDGPPSSGKRRRRNKPRNKTGPRKRKKLQRQTTTSDPSTGSLPHDAHSIERASVALGTTVGDSTPAPPPTITATGPVSAPATTNTTVVVSTPPQAPPVPAPGDAPTPSLLTDLPPAPAAPLLALASSTDATPTHSAPQVVTTTPEAAAVETPVAAQPVTPGTAPISTLPAIPVSTAVNPVVAPTLQAPVTPGEAVPPPASLTNLPPAPAAPLLALASSTDATPTHSAPQVLTTTPAAAAVETPVAAQPVTPGTAPISTLPALPQTTALVDPVAPTVSSLTTSNSRLVPVAPNATQAQNQKNRNNALPKSVEPVDRIIDYKTTRDGKICHVEFSKSTPGTKRTEWVHERDMYNIAVFKRHFQLIDAWKRSGDPSLDAFLSTVEGKKWKAAFRGIGADDDSLTCAYDAVGIALRLLHLPNLVTQASILSFRERGSQRRSRSTNYLGVRWTALVEFIRQLGVVDMPVVEVNLYKGEGIGVDAFLALKPDPGIYLVAGFSKEGIGHAVVAVVPDDSLLKTKIYDNDGAHKLKWLRGWLREIRPSCSSRRLACNM